MKTYPYPYHKGIIRACTREPFYCSNIRLFGPVASHAGIEPTVQPMLMTQIKEPQISPGLSCAYSSGVQ